jgi:hypothetical protein
MQTDINRPHPLSVAIYPLFVLANVVRKKYYLRV